MTINSILNKLIDLFGTQTNLAHHIGVEPMAISQWKKRGSIPLKRAKQIEKITLGQITVADIISLQADIAMVNIDSKGKKKRHPVRKNRQKQGAA